MNECLLYSKTKKLPEIFQESDINLIIKKLFESKDYWKNDLGLFIKWRDIALISTIYLLATRPLESCRLQFKDFDFKRSLVKIRGSKRHKDRVIPVPKKLLEIYEEYFKFPRNRFWKGSPYLFPSFGNKGFISPSTLKGIFREKALKPAGLWHFNRFSKAEFRTLYKLRHSRASHILQKQIKQGKPDIFSIANLLGHSDIRSTMVYLHTDNKYMDYLRQQIEF